MSTKYNKKKYHEQIDTLLKFVDDRGKTLVKDKLDLIDCQSTIDIIKQCSRGQFFNLFSKHFASTTKKYFAMCLEMLRDSDIESKEYRKLFCESFMLVVDNLKFVPLPRKEQVRKIINSDRVDKDDIATEKELIKQLQLLLCTILPKYTKKYTPEELYSFVENKNKEVFNELIEAGVQK